MMPLRYFIKDMQLDSELLKIVMPNLNQLAGSVEPKNNNKKPIRRTEHRCAVSER